jgi:hypothetical protein
MVTRGLSSLDLAELDLSPLNPDLLRTYAGHFPAGVQALLVSCHVLG